MPLPSKPGTVIVAQSANDLPRYEIKFPEEVLARFPALRDTQRQVVTYHESVKKVLTRLIDEQNRARTTLQLALDAMATAQTALTAQVTALEVAPVVETETVNLTPVTDALEAHISATSAHGTSGVVVGDTDEQALERKSIGMTDARHGRFMSAINRSEVGPGETWVIPAGFAHVVAGPFVVSGYLRIEGTLLVM